MKIIKYEDKYRDDMIFMILEAKNALGRVPGLNEDLLNIKKNYLDVGDMFWLAIDEQDRVSGSIGYNSIRDTDEVWLHRLFVKYNLKRQGIGSALLEMAENYIANQGKKVVRIHLGGEDEDETIIISAKREAYEEANIGMDCKYSVLDTQIAYQHTVLKKQEKYGVKIVWLFLNIHLLLEWIQQF